MTNYDVILTRTNAFLGVVLNIAGLFVQLFSDRFAHVK